MRVFVVIVMLSAAVLSPKVGNAQVYQLSTPSLQVTAANAGWITAGQPIVYAGASYYPAGSTVVFDPSVMVPTGIFEGVPLYADATLEPGSVVLVPIGGKELRPYERRRSAALAGTVGSRIPSSEPSQARRIVLQTIPRPVSNVGVWIEFQGERWRGAGAAVSYSPDRFEAIGEYHGFPVYRDVKGQSRAIYVPAVRDGALTPYSKF